MKTFDEAFAARGLDDWDVAQAIKKLQAALKRNLTRPDVRSYPTAADLAHYVKTGRTGPALTAAYVAQYDNANRLHQLAVSPAPTFTAAPQVATVRPDAGPRSGNPGAQSAVEGHPARAARTRQSPRRNPLDTLLFAVHDAHLAAREGARRARHHITTA